MLRERVGPEFPLSPQKLNELLDPVYDSLGAGRLPYHHKLDPDMLPSRQPLALRFRDYYRRAVDSLSSAAGARFTPGPAMDRFRDIPPALVLAVFEGDLAVIEPGSVGPMPMGHPVVSSLIDCINRRYVTSSILSLLIPDNGGEEMEETVSSKLYDGGLVVGVLDYRRAASFATVTASQAHNAPGHAAHTPQGLLSAMATQGIAPEMHKVFLRPSYAALAPFMNAEDEDEILLALYPSIVTDPSPACWQALEWSLYDRDKLAVHCADWLTDYPTGDHHHCQSSSSKPQVEPLPPIAKLKQLAALDEYKSRRCAGSAEAFLGIDQRRNLARSRSQIPTTVMNNPNQRVWRTVRFEREHENLRKSHYSVNIVALNNGAFEVILRRGSLPDTAQGPQGFTQRFQLPSLSAVEVYLTNLKHLFALEDFHRKLTVDVANPAVLNSATSTATTPLSGRNLQPPSLPSHLLPSRLS